MIDMERITGFLDDGTIFVRSKDGKSGTGYFTTQERLPEIVTKLSAYEDTGLTPEQIVKIDQLYQEKCQEVATFVPVEGYVYKGRQLYVKKTEPTEKL